MSSSNYFRSWINRPHLDPNTRLLTEEYQRGITEFMGLVHQQPEAKTGMLRCPYSNCKNRKVIKEWDVWTHLYLSGFTRSYKIWYHHGETDYEHGSTSEPQPAVRLEEPIRTDVDYGVGTTFLGNFRGPCSSEIPDANSEEDFVGTSEDWTIGNFLGIYRGSPPSVYSEELSDDLVVLGVSSEIQFLRIP
ncbi:hypothetical protein F2Q69_00007822 [Brassica cretica]|uniref:Transposase-associated domain-containing protein n=1 Tax=Brassica cretica TaxID=69181 RepID=A0A8S9P8K8_BRACR|nr:hypothetical protein F2Q69_00007822 [Brassica cretica]